ncbi:MAG: hypothetical protein LBI33_10455 [Propionibacteriaceae bacterium]|jgi:hypothetical protein|nr:hypothetical protein [Propionibacteriaceae bacterium]
MCSPVKCQVCGKTTWAGCGQHIAQVKAMVPKGQWCDGRHTPDEIAAAKATKSSFFSRFRGQ